MSYSTEGHRLGSPGASHGGYGGRGRCENDYLTCRMVRGDPFGSMYHPVDFGMGGHGSFGGTGKITLKHDSYLYHSLLGGVISP